MASGTEIEERVALLLRAGVAVSGALMGAGLAWWAARGGPAGEGLLRWGVLILLCTPVARVAALTAEHLRRREWGFASAGLSLLAMLALSAALGAAH